MTAPRGASHPRSGPRSIALPRSPRFVIDDSGSTCDAQVGLAAVLPELVDAIFDTLPANAGIHVGLTTTTFGDGGQHQLVPCLAVEGPATIEAKSVLDAHVPATVIRPTLRE